MLAEAANPASRFAGRLRADAIGMSGLSFGGFTTLLAEVQEPRIRAALSMVPGGTATLGQNQIAMPTMVIGSERDMVVGYAESVSAFGHLAGPRYLIELLAANHLSVVDDCRNPTLGTNFCVAADISQEDAHRLVLHYAVPFFRHYLSGRPRPTGLLDQPIAGVTLQAEP
jgi:predicted dienelactone hydrolase